MGIVLPLLAKREMLIDKAACMLDQMGEVGYDAIYCINTKLTYTFCLNTFNHKELNLAPAILFCPYLNLGLKIRHPFWFWLTSNVKDQLNLRFSTGMRLGTPAPVGNLDSSIATWFEICSAVGYKRYTRWESLPSRLMSDAINDTLQIPAEILGQLGACFLDAY
ncbi:hypothetical protein M514_18714 [Trichuris suis]|uniref:Uncharacterized protein n=1 Tax=Trichuris suis TaxID=68888 RepID=A0A085NI41_9BILA|nr:hypothetical protein M514_18714 [Trichuris suis]